MVTSVPTVEDAPLQAGVRLARIEIGHRNVLSPEKWLYSCKVKIESVLMIILMGAF